MSKFFNGVIIGAVLGGVWGLLNAPRSGKETRQKLSHEIQDFTSSVQEFSANKQQAQAAFHHLTTEGFSLAHQILQEVQQAIEVFQEENQPTVDRIHQKVDKLKQDVGINELWQDSADETDA